jgi:hypothetical protein
MVLNTAWPLLANAKPADPALPSEICSASGLKHAADGAPAAPAKGLHASHCTLCPFSSQWVAGIADAGLRLVPPPPSAGPVRARGEIPRPEIAFHPAAPPRAPPSQS